MTGPSENSLFATLSLYTRLYHKHITLEELINGLPTPSGEAEPRVHSAEILKDNFSRAADRAGLRSRLVERPLDQISPMTLPAILALKDGTGCILDTVSPDRKQYRILQPETADGMRWTAADTLRDLYSGYFYLLGQKHKRVENRQSLIDKRGHWLWDAIRLSLPLYRDIVLASLFTNLFTVATPLFAMNVYDRVVPTGAMDTLWVLVTGVVVTVVLDSILRAQRSYFVEVAAKKSDVIVSSRLFEKVMDLRMEDGPRDLGAFAANLREFDTIRNFLTATVLLVVVDLPFTVLFLGVIWYIAGPLMFVPAGLMLTLLVYSLAVRGPLKKAIIEVFEENARKNSLLIESIAGLKDIKLNNAAGLFQWRWENSVAELARKSVRSRLLGASLSTVTSILVQMDYILIVLIGVYMINAHELTIGGLISVSILASRAISPTGQVVGLLSNYEHAHEAYESLCGIMNRRVENPADVEMFHKDTLAAELEFRDVSLVYPESQKYAIHQVSFKIARGERVGLLGRNGSGKTSIQGIILGFYRPQLGAVTIDSLDLTRVSPALLRKHVACVPQDFSLFSGTLRENIRLKAPNAPDDAVMAAARLGNLEHLIRSHPAGLDMPIAERGANLSGGQRQGVAIARAFVLDAPLVMMDEPTSAMDGSAEVLVKENIKQKIKGKTFILTTHKNGLLDMVDRVLLMDMGRLIFDGPRDEFIKRYTQ
jgi:ATP-binding cassette subfamily C protein LapB